MAAPISILESSLTDEQKDRLYDWLLEMPVPKVAEKLALPAPEGFGIKTHTTTLQRFKNRRFAEHGADQIEDAAQLADSTAGHAETLDNGIASALKRHFFQRASAPDATDAQLALVARWFHRNEKHKLDVQRVQIARERLVQNNRRLDLVERAVKVREDALALRREQLAAKASSNSDPSNQIKADHLGPYARNAEELSERVRKQQGVPKEEWDRRIARTREILKQRYNPDGTLKVPATHNPSAPDVAQTINLPEPTSPQNQSSELTDSLNH